MRKTVVALLLLCGLVALGSCGELYDPEQIVRTTCFEQYYTLGSVYEEFKGKNFSAVVSLLAKDSFVYVAPGEMERLWDEDWTLNESIPWFDEIVAEYPFDEKQEDLLCVTLTEDIDYMDEGGDSAYSCVFAVNKESRESLPVMFFNTEDGKIKDDITIGAEESITSFYFMTKYMIKDVDTLRTVVYSDYN